MKKLLLAVASLSLAGFTQAALLQCTPTNANTINSGAFNNPTVLNCGSIDAGAGNVITNLAIRALGSFNDAIENTNHQVNFSFSHSASAATHSITTGVGDLSGNAPPSVGASVLVGTQTFAASTISVTTSNAIGFGSPDNASVTAWLSYDVSPVQTGVPEPSTMALLGSALVGLGVLSRRKK